MCHRSKLMLTKCLCYIRAEQVRDVPISGIRLFMLHAKQTDTCTQRADCDVSTQDASNGYQELAQQFCIIAHVTFVLFRCSHNNLAQVIHTGTVKMPAESDAFHHDVQVKRTEGVSSTDIVGRMLMLVRDNNRFQEVLPLPP